MDSIQMYGSVIDRHHLAANQKAGKKYTDCREPRFINKYNAYKQAADSRRKAYRQGECVDRKTRADSKQTDNKQNDSLHCIYKTEIYVYIER